MFTKPYMNLKHRNTKQTKSIAHMQRHVAEWLQIHRCRMQETCWTRGERNHRIRTPCLYFLSPRGTVSRPTSRGANSCSQTRNTKVKRGNEHEGNQLPTASFPPLSSLRSKTKCYSAPRFDPLRGELCRFPPPRKTVRCGWKPLFSSNLSRAVCFAEKGKRPTVHFFFFFNQTTGSKVKKEHSSN